MNKKIIETVDAIVETVNPRGGKGVTESVVVVIIVTAVVYCEVKGIEISPLLTTAFGTVLGWLTKSNAKRNEDKDNE